ncbi:VacJ family lipoprotein [Colwellia sp. BRX8-7]|jgi:phospholipid-binding lipoprotein MlaA|nr:VacJ family lipoprotein [Colwellia sp. BRX8-7]
MTLCKSRRIHTLPVVAGYKAITPDFVERAVSIFYKRMRVFCFYQRTFTSKPSVGVETLGHFTVNTTLGIFGVFDAVTKIGLDEQNEDFGQTLG